MFNTVFCWSWFACTDRATLSAIVYFEWSPRQEPASYFEKLCARNTYIHSSSKPTTILFTIEHTEHAHGQKYVYFTTALITKTLLFFFFYFILSSLPKNYSTENLQKIKQTSQKRTTLQ